MKISKISIFLIVLIVLGLASLISSAKNENKSHLSKNNFYTSNKADDASQKSLENNEFKVMAYHSGLKNEMNMLNYKIVTLSNTEMVFYKATINNLPTNEESTNCKKTFIYTQLFLQIQLPCNEKEELCTVEELEEKYKGKYSEIDWAIPSHLQNITGLDVRKNCLTIITDAFSSLDENLFICSKDLTQLLKVKKFISQRVLASYTNKSTEFSVDFIQNNDIRGIVSGLLRFEKETVKFINSDNKKLLLEFPYNKIVLFPFAYYGKESFPNIGKGSENFDQKCFKVPIYQGTNKDNKIFCVSYSSGDFTKKNPLQLYKSRWLAEYYTERLNKRLLPIMCQDSIQKLTPIKDSLEVESKILIPITQDVRQKYRRILYENTLAKKLLSEQTKEKELDEVIKESCNSISLCVRAIKYKIKNGFCPMENSSNIAMSKENPYLSLYPNNNIRVDTIPDGVAKNLIEEVSRLKGKENYFTEEVDLPLGGVPDKKAIGKAFKQFKEMRKKGLYYKHLSEFKRCRTYDKGNSLARKMSLLTLFTSIESDFLFSFLGSIEDKLSTK